MFEFCHGKKRSAIANVFVKPNYVYLSAWKAILLVTAGVAHGYNVVSLLAWKAILLVTAGAAHGYNVVDRYLPGGQYAADCVLPSRQQTSAGYAHGY